MRNTVSMAPLESRVSKPRGPRPSDCERRRRRRRRRHLTARLRCKRETATASRQSHPSWGSTASVANATYPTAGPRRAQDPAATATHGRDVLPRCLGPADSLSKAAPAPRPTGLLQETPGLLRETRESLLDRDSPHITIHLHHCSPNSRTTQPPGRLDSLLAPKPQARPRPLPAHGGWWQWCVEAWV